MVEAQGKGNLTTVASASLKNTFLEERINSQTPCSSIDPQHLNCPICGSAKVYCNGHRTLKDGSGRQRRICGSCGYRFTEPTTLKTVCVNSLSSRISAEKAKNLAAQTKTKLCASDLKKVPQDARGLITKYAAYLEREGYYGETSYYDLICSLAIDGANLLDPEDVKDKIAKHTYKNKKGETLKWKDSSKMLAVYAYAAFCTMEGITWTKPRYRQEESEIIFKDEKDLDALINAAESRRMATYLQCLKETFADPGEILRLEWSEIKGNIIYIQHPVKGHYPGHNEVSPRLISMLSALPRKDVRVFPTTYHIMHNCFNALKRATAKKLQNPALLSITFKDFRHWGGSMLAHYTNGNVLKVKTALRHKSILSTMKYIHTLNFKNEDFETATATTPEEILAFGKAGWQKYDEATFNGTQIHFYRRPKRFGGM